MPSLNRATLIGYLGKDPEVKYLPSGTTVANFSLATTEKWQDQQSGTWQEKTEWHNIVAFGRIAEICSEYVQKGNLVYLEGKIQTRTWEDKNGVKRQTTSIVVNMIKNLSGKPKSDEGQGDLPGGLPPGDNSDVPF